MMAPRIKARSSLIEAVAEGLYDYDEVGPYRAEWDQLEEHDPDQYEAYLLDAEPIADRVIEYVDFWLRNTAYGNFVFLADSWKQEMGREEKQARDG